jgi:hypothetical protein
MSGLKNWLLLILLAGVFAAGYIYSGHYSVAADVPHNKLTYWLLEAVRERSIAAASRDIEVPELSDSNLLLEGGPDYNEMCAGCHLEPGKTESDLSVGLYPTPPNLSASADGHDHSHSKAGDGSEAEQLARRQFWVIKHGIKASGMPAWGLTHDEGRIWAMVAFLQQLPNLTAEQYQVLTARDETEEHGHQ